jgi:ferredoxin
MRSPFLRSFRILFSALVFICFFLLFADFKYLIPSKYINILISLQFIPSILKFHDLGTLVTAGFAAVMILTILTGRTYCSFLCPLGTGQDINSRIGGRIKRKFRRYGYKKPFTVLRYFLLAATVIVSLVLGYLLTVLDPYSVFGRFMTYFSRPVVLVINNFIAGILGRFDIYTLNHIHITGFQLLAYSIPVVFLLLVSLLSLTKGRLYCNMICPVGTLLGLLSKVSLLRIKMDENKCTRCGRCSIGCKSSCIDFLQHGVDMSRCVICFNCINTCQEKAISYGFPWSKRKNDEEADPSRRKFVAASVLLLFGIQQAARAQDKTVPVPKKVSTVKENKTLPVCPPGGVSIEDFNLDCTACSLCISACPNGVLVPALLQYGVAGMMQPVMDYHKSFCTYNCTRCTEICPTNALHPLVLEAKKLTQLGKSNFIKDNCIVKTEKTACGACSEACPTKAVYMIPYEGNLVIPETNQDICIGCGHCEYACPTTPYKAIFVDGNAVHQAAKKPVNVQSEIETPVEFPF